MVFLPSVADDNEKTCLTTGDKQVFARAKARGGSAITSV
jgi:hypothetical protein